MSQITKNLKQINEQSASSGRAIGESGHIHNLAHLNGGPYIVPTHNANKWEGFFPNTSPTQVSDSFYNGTINIEVDSAGSNAGGYIFPKNLDMTDFLNGKIKMFARSESAGVYGGNVDVSFVSDVRFEDNAFALYQIALAFDGGYTSGDWVELEGNIVDGSFVIVGDAKPNLSEVEGFSVSLASTGSIDLSAIRLFV